jgi:hypothetical protein
MKPSPSPSPKPVEPTRHPATTLANEPAQIRKERPEAKTQSVQTPQGGNEGKGGGMPKSASPRP